MKVQVVWFKRDLRIYDNEALFKAIESGPVICIYIIESGYWELPCASNRQWTFIRQSLFELNSNLRNIGLSLHIVMDDALSVMTRLFKRYGNFKLHSHQETGNLWTYRRDKEILWWCKSNNIEWSEYAQNGVYRPAKNRNNSFRKHWEQWAAQSMFDVQFGAQQQNEYSEESLNIKLPIKLKEDEIECPFAQNGGRVEGLRLLNEFMESRGHFYQSGMSSPLTAENSCSRLSPYIAYGCLSLREVVQRVNSEKQIAKDTVWRRSLSAFRTRLWWHCYWLQTLENNPDVEIKCLVSQMQLLNRPFQKERFEAWKYGKTGWPLVDACMRYLHHHGWINFRMRAMLVSIATCTLSLPWKPVAEWLASMFVDFEPGIHYPQIQMHSGTAGGTILRIYNPVLQAGTLDPDGIFVRQWVPELKNYSESWLLRPWDMPDSLRFRDGFDSANGYPKPLVNFEHTNKNSKEELTSIKRRFAVEPARGYNESVARKEAGIKSMQKSKRVTDSEIQGDLFK